ncbi:21 kDa protein [Ziziphus jujuba]|uniref:21 kDa protein n=2 Tax=Ziziphus jujuba TaxID=326968 RepID=A0A6P4B0Y4_ZIZJJ|nr:21 kDa protein [Ziziphus jujuba]KAH7516310.1 hypothetical protein FEM48_Zijuj10G0121600 [Ziziphus jujuba var. spinosa]
MRTPFIFLICLWLATSLTAAYAEETPSPTNNNENSTDFIRTSCGTTLYPKLCYTSLSRYASAIQQNPAQLALVAMHVTLSKSKHMTTYISNLTRQADYGANPRTISALHDCFSNFGDAVDEINGSVKQMKNLGVGGGGDGQSLRFQLSNVQTWMSAALTDQETCTDGFEDVPECPIKKDVCNKATYVKQHTSNALALINSYAAKVTP